jgi:MFS family permease
VVTAAPAAHEPTEPAGPARFAALRNRDCRPYLIGSGIAMMADNIEHVITYWVLWQTFHSESLVGFQVISHWVPFLLFSVYFGNLADRFDCRRVIQAGQCLFMAVSIAWGVLFLTGSLQMWHACVLLVLHGMAGAMWGPGEQLMLHDFVGSRDLPSAIRMNATFKSLGMLCGPVVGSALLLGLGPTLGIFVNAGLYLPLTIFLLVTKFTGHSRADTLVRPRLGLRQAVTTLRRVSTNRTLMSMVILGGLGSFFIGSSVQAAMPAFASQLGIGSAGASYGLLLFATGVGGVVGGFVLEAAGGIRPSVAVAMVSTFLMGLATGAFALTHSYVLALFFLVAAGVANMVSMSVGQTVVQLEAPPNERGSVVGVYAMSSGGLRAGSGLTVGMLGILTGIRTSLALSAAALCLCTLLTAALTYRNRRPGEPPVVSDDLRASTPGAAARSTP